MLHVSRFVRAAALTGPFIASLWQGEVPHDFVLHRWIYLRDDDPLEALLIWEGGPDAEAFLAQRFEPFGEFSTKKAHDATASMQGCLARDLDAFEAGWTAARDVPESVLRANLELRRLALGAATLERAREIGQSWQQSQTSGS